jgi:hypothetical protein
MYLIWYTLRDELCTVREGAVRLLLEKGAAVDVTNRDGRTALEVASSSVVAGRVGKKVVVSMLQKAKEAMEVTRQREANREHAALFEKDNELARLREANRRLCRENAALLEKDNQVTRGLKMENSRLRSDLLVKADVVSLLRKEIDRLRNDNAALTRGMAEMTRRVEVKKEFTKATVDRLQKVRPQ